MGRRSGDERREHVLDAAIAEFATQGYHAASTTAIARRAGISQPYNYALYRNKRELFLAAHRQVSERIRACLVDAAHDGADAEDRLRAMGDAYLRLIADTRTCSASSRPTRPRATRRCARPCARSSCASSRPCAR